MDFFIGLASFALIVFMGAASPGPDFIMVIRNSVLHSRRAGIFTALGIGLGNGIQISFCVLGIAALISKSVAVFAVIKYIGAAYLIYIGVKALRSKGYENQKVVGQDKQRADLPPHRAFTNGLFTNLLNPKATLFWLALFTQVIDPETAFNIQSLYGLTAVTVVTIWFMFVSITLNQRHIRRVFMASAKWIDRICGGLLIALGLKLALSHA